MRKLLIVGNWKMNLNVEQASLLVHQLESQIPIHKNIEVVLAPGFLALQPISLQIDRRRFRLAAQNAYPKDEGAYTGEVSFNMLRDLVHYVIIGHSERRHILGEDLPLIRDKMAACVRNGLTPILCVGETNSEHDDGETKRVIHDQLLTGLANLTAREVAEITIAYEPVWAIGTGRAAKPADVRSVASYIRDYVAGTFGEPAAQSLRLLYGGSVTPSVVKAFLDEPGIDGFLVGGASLNAETFSGIVAEAYDWQRSTTD